VLGLETTYTADVTGAIASAHDDVGGGSQLITEVTGRDANGNVVAFKDAGGRQWAQEFDYDNRLKWRRAPDGRQTDYVYTPGGRLACVFRGTEKTEFKYDLLGNVVEAKDATNCGTAAAFDEHGRTLSSGRIGETATIYTYQPGTKQLVNIAAPGGRSTTFQPDEFGRVKFIFDPKLNVTVHDYDDLDRIKKITHPDGKMELFDYGANGDLWRHTDRVGRVTEFSYNQAGRVTQRRFRDTGEVATTGYNAAGQMTNSAFNGSSASWEFDLRGRRWKINGNAVVFTYNNDDTLATKVYGGQTLSYTYNESTGQLTAVSGLGGNAGFEYYQSGDNLGRLKKLTLPGNVSREIISYDDAGRALALTQTLGGNTEAYTFGFDTLGRLQNHALSGQWAVTYGYDSASRLQTETRTGVGAYNYLYGYDLNDNRLTQTGSVYRTFAYNALNQLTGITGDETETATFTYDDAGNQVTRVLNNVTTTCGYDRLNRLASVTGGGNASTYTYRGASWMRNTATVNGNTTSYVWDGSSCVAKTDVATTLYAVPGSSPLWEKTGGGAPVTYAQDGQGNVTGLWNGSNYVATFRYDAFGRLTTTGTPSDPHGPRYRGYLYDAATSNYATGWRAYDPSTARFTSMDPLGDVNGPNRYGYCGGDPVNRTDPMGLDYIDYTGPSDNREAWYVVTDNSTNKEIRRFKIGTLGSYKSYYGISLRIDFADEFGGGSLASSHLLGGFEMDVRFLGKFDQLIRARDEQTSREHVAAMVQGMAVRGHIDGIISAEAKGRAAIADVQAKENSRWLGRAREQGGIVGAANIFTYSFFNTLGGGALQSFDASLGSYDAQQITGGQLAWSATGNTLRAGFFGAVSVGGMEGNFAGGGLRASAKDALAVMAGGPERNGNRLVEATVAAIAKRRGDAVVAVENLQSIGSKDLLTIVAHGSESSMGTLSAETWARLLQVSGFKGGAVELVACNTGAGSFGPRLASLLSVPVKAPLGKVFPQAAGGLRIEVNGVLLPQGEGWRWFGLK
jgi:RHS repeat-associated protein